MFFCRARVAGLVFALLVISPVGAAVSRYDRTVQALQFSPPEWRGDFASIALLQLADSYYAEADLARTDAMESPGQQETGEKQSQWSGSVEHYASQLQRLKVRVDNGAEAALWPSPGGDVMLEISRQQVMLSHPRPEQQSAFEQLVLEQYCQLRDCYALTGIPESRSGRVGDAVPDSTTAANSAVAERGRPSWSFTVDGPVCTYDGIRLKFQPGDNSGAVRKLCLQLFDEVSRLLEGMTVQQSYGVPVDGAELALSGSADGIEQVFKLNGAGDVLSLPAPLIGARPALLSGLRPWLLARLGGRSYALELTASEFGWQGAAINLNP